MAAATHVSPNVTIFPCQCANRVPLVISGQRHYALDLTISTSTYNTPDEKAPTHTWSSAALNSLPSGDASGTSKNLFLRTNTT